MVGKAYLKMLFFRIKKRKTLLLIWLLTVSVVLPYLTITIICRSNIKDLFEWPELPAYYLTVVCLLSCLLPLEMMRIYVETTGNETFLLYCRYPHSDACAVLPLCLIFSGFSVLQLTSYTEYCLRLTAVLLCTIVFVNLTGIALYSLSGSYATTLIACLLLSAGLFIPKNPVLSLSEITDNTELRHFFIRIAVLIILMLAADFAAVRRIRYRTA